MLIWRSANVATPATAATVVVLLAVNASGKPVATVTSAMLTVRLPAASRIRTVTAGVMACPACVSVGCTSNASVAGAPDVTFWSGDRFALLPL